VHWYDAPGHLFSDAGNADYDAAATALMQQRVLDFLAKL
jgi:hypothetical protein